MSSNSDSVARILLIAIAILVLLPVVAMLVFMPTMGMWMSGPMQPGGQGGWTAPGWMLGFWGVGLLVLIAGGYLLYRGLTRTGTDPAMEELRQAYARGDISEDEFEERRRRLEE